MSTPRAVAAASSESTTVRPCGHALADRRSERTWESPANTGRRNSVVPSSQIAPASTGHDGHGDGPGTTVAGEPLFVIGAGEVEFVSSAGATRPCACLLYTSP